jgi:hypothetical protein
MERIQQERLFLVIKYGSSILYKDAYYRVPTKITSNTCTTIAALNRYAEKSTVTIMFNKDDGQNIKEKRVRIDGRGPLDRNKLRRFQRRPLQVYNPSYYYGGSNSDEDEDDIYK